MFFWYTVFDFGTFMNRHVSGPESHLIGILRRFANNCWISILGAGVMQEEWAINI